MPLNNSYSSTSQLPSLLPVFPLTGVLLLPGSELPLNIFEPRYLRLIDDAIASHRTVGMIQPKDPAGNLFGTLPLRRIGCAGRITQFSETGDRRYIIGLTGVMRFRIREETTTVEPYRLCDVDYSEFEHDLQSPPDVEIDREKFIQTLQSFSVARQIRLDPDELKRTTNDVLVNAVSVIGPFGPEEKQLLLEAPTIKSRADALITMMEIASAGDLGEYGKLQ